METFGKIYPHMPQDAIQFYIKHKFSTQNTHMYECIFITQPILSIFLVHFANSVTLLYTGFFPSSAQCLIDSLTIVRNDNAHSDCSTNKLNNSWAPQKKTKANLW